MNVEINIEKTFLKPIDKHFPKTNKFHKIFNRDNVKVSYSCLPNFFNMIKLQNNRILSEEKSQDQPKFNCRQKRYLSSRRKLFRRGTNIPMQFEQQSYRKYTLQNYQSISGKWKEKASENQSYIGQLLIVPNHIRTGQKGCNLCLTEKYLILKSQVNLINKRSKLVSKCRH